VCVCPGHIQPLGHFVILNWERDAIRLARRFPVAATARTAVGSVAGGTVGRLPSLFNHPCFIKFCSYNYLILAQLHHTSTPEGLFNRFPFLPVRGNLIRLYIYNLGRQ